MDFWTSARASFHGATECLRLDHTIPGEVELHIDRCQSILQSLMSLHSLETPEEDVETLDRWITTFEERLDQLQTVADNITREDNNNQTFQLGIHVESVKTEGRPRKEIDLPTVLSLLPAGYQKQEIADIAGLSRSTLLRRMKSIQNLVLNPDDTDVLVQEWNCTFPNAGARFIKGALTSQGYIPTRQSIRDSLFRVDPESVLRRRHISLPRRVRKYWVPYPNAIWHFDGHEKLIA